MSLHDMFKSGFDVDVLKFVLNTSLLSYWKLNMNYERQNSLHFHV